MTYNDIVITSIDVRRLGNGRVEFDSSIKGDKNDATAVFLENVRRTGRKTKPSIWNRSFKRFPIFEGNELSLEEVKKRMPPSENVHPVLCIHGASTAPEDIIAHCHDANQRYAKSGSDGQSLKLKFIPVIWPTEESINGYRIDRWRNSVGGKAFKAMADIAAEFPQKSLMAHSMGSRVLRYFASFAFKFDNIFLVAADVNHRLFNQEYIDERHDENSRYKDGLRIHSMLQNDDTGKICVLFHKKDRALSFSNAEKFFSAPRLGRRGVKESELHSNFKGRDIIKNTDFTDRVSIKFWNHNYQFSDETIEFYHEVIRGN